MQITGKISSPGTNPPSNYTPAILTETGTSSFNVLTNYNITTYIVGSITNGVTNNPTVAWTYDPGSLPANGSQYYGNPAIVASHAYSIIGTYANIATGMNYIVLRNPWGNQINPDDPSLGALQASLAQGTWTPMANAPNVNFGNQADGIFALESSVFDLVFAGFGWVC
jgi:hypothetical protein